LIKKVRDSRKKEPLRLPVGESRKNHRGFSWNQDLEKKSRRTEEILLEGECRSTRVLKNAGKE